MKLKFRVLITGTGRSGTTLAWKLLNVHPDLNIAYEPFNNEGMKLRELIKCDGIKQPIVGFDFIKHCEVQKTIIMLRDMRDTLYSFITRNKKSYSTIMTFYNQFLSLNKDFVELSHKNPEKVILVHYEKLCLRTQSELNRICKFLKIDYLSIMLNKWNTIKSPNEPYSSLKRIEVQTSKYKGDKNFISAITKVERENGIIYNNPIVL